MYYNGAMEFRQNENANIDFELAALKDAKVLRVLFIGICKYVLYILNKHCYIKIVYFVND